METIIKVTSSEFDKNLVDKIKKFIGNAQTAEITISINDNIPKGYLRNESRDEYFTRLNKSLENEKQGNVIRFTAKEFENFSLQLLNEQ